MKRTVPAALGVVLGIMVAFGQTHTAQAELKDGDRVPGVLIVVFADGVIPEYEQDLKGRSSMGIGSVDAINAQFQLRSFRRQFPSVNVSSPPRSVPALGRYHVLRFPKDIDLDEAAAAYLADPAVERVEFDAYAVMLATPNDPRYGEMWSLEQPSDHDVDADSAWDFTTGSPNIILGVTDTGVLWSHEDLQGNIWVNPGEDIDGDGEVYDADDMNGIDDDGNGYVDDVIGWDFVTDGTIYGYDIWDGEDGMDQDNDPKDFYGHGTHVSGTIAAVTNNGIGISGLAGGYGTANPGSRIMCLRMGWALNIFGSRRGITEMSYVAEAFVYAADNGARAVNYSFGSSSGGGIEAATDYAVSQGVIFCIAAGNSNSETNYGYLQLRPDVITVASTNEADARSPFSNYGGPVDIAAPGSNILSTYSDEYVPTYSTRSGTSMATPHVVGLAGMILSVNPALSRTDVLDIMQTTADSTIDYVGQMGGGRINALKAVQQAKSVRIAHVPLENSRDPLGDYEVVAVITSDTALDLNALFVRHTVDASETELFMQPTGNPNEFHAFIPAQTPGTSISYYLEAHDLRGDSVATPIYTFWQVDYEPLLRASNSWIGRAALDTAWFSLTVVNRGVFDDDIQLALSDQTWTARIFDATGLTEIATTGVLASDDSLDFKVHVEIPASVHGDVDTFMVLATSTGNPIRVASIELVAMSIGVPLATPFYDPFNPSITADSNLWLESEGIAISDVGILEPSPAHSANINGHPIGSEVLSSLPIDLEGSPPMTLSYAFQKTGGGDSPFLWADLYVEYFTESGTWELIEEYKIYDYPDMSHYEVVTFPLPPPAYHQGFRVQFRNFSGPSSEPRHNDWFVDNVLIDDRPHVAAAPFGIEETYVSPDSSELELLVWNVGQGTLDVTASLELPPGPEWMTLPTFSASLQGGQNQTMTVMVRTADLSQGVYTAQIYLHSNDADPFDTLEVLPVTVVVTECHCPIQGDPSEDGFINIIDAIMVIDYIFRSAPPLIHDFGCPSDRGDVNDDGITNVIDAIYLIDHTFRTGPPPLDPCYVP